MFDQLFGLILLGLGIQAPQTPSRVKGETTEVASISAKRAAFREKLQIVRDEKKRDKVEKIQEKLIQLNTLRADVMTKHVTKMSEILERLSEKLEKQVELGIDVQSGQTALTTAQSALTAAQEAVTTQAGKSYEITLTNETNVKSDVDSVRRRLATDLKGVHQKLVSARRAISTAIRTIAKLAGEQVPEEVIQ